MKKIRKNLNEYRVVHKATGSQYSPAYNISEINIGDWVTISKKYSKED